MNKPSRMDEFVSLVEAEGDKYKDCCAWAVISADEKLFPDYYDVGLDYETTGRHFSSQHKIPIIFVEKCKDLQEYVTAVFECLHKEVIFYAKVHGGCE